MQNNVERAAILQTGRLGDLWFTLPLAHHLHQQGLSVDIVYDAQFGSPFTFAPYVNARPVTLTEPFKFKGRWSYAGNQAVNQLRLYRSLKPQYQRTIWRQIFPYRWLGAIRENRPWPCQWYAEFPEISFRRVPTTLECRNEKTILLLTKSQSVRFNSGDAHVQWIEENLNRLVEATKYTPVYVAYGNEPDHPKYQTWRGSLAEYQQLVAHCGMVYGIITSAHVLGQLLGKAVVPLYGDRKAIYDTIGDEDAILFPHDRLDAGQIDKVIKKIGAGPAR
jgi:hypothetical protein